MTIKIEARRLSGVDLGKRIRAFGAGFPAEGSLWSIHHNPSGFVTLIIATGKDTFTTVGTPADELVDLTGKESASA